MPGHTCSHCHQPVLYYMCTDGKPRPFEPLQRTTEHPYRYMASAHRMRPLIGAGWGYKVHGCAQARRWLQTFEQPLYQPPARNPQRLTELEAEAAANRKHFGRG